MPPTIVWIEDDTDIIGSVVEPLKEAGYRIVSLPTIAAALDDLEEIRNADLILLDMLLPIGTINPAMKVDFSKSYYTGRDLLRLFRKHYNVTTPTIALTVARDQELMADLNRLDAMVVHKPVRPSVLMEQAEAVMQSYRARPNARR